MIWNRYPYTDLHELNLDFILRKIKEIGIRMDEFEVLNAITYKGLWDITEQYTAWSLVTDNNNVYISLKPVPAGIDINNTEYWALLLDYSIFMQDFDNRLTAVETDVSEIHTEITRKMLFIGDSFGEGGSGWIQQVKNRIGDASAFSYAEGGIGFCNPGNNTGVAIQDAVTAYFGTLTSAELNSITEAVVILGENDTVSTYSAADIKSAATLFFRYLAQNLPNIKRIHVGYNGTYLVPQNAMYGARNQYKERTRTAIMSAAGEAQLCGYHIEYECSIMNVGLVEASGVHPTANGYQLLADAVTCSINGGTFDYQLINTSNGIQFKTLSRYVEITVPINTIFETTGSWTIASYGMTSLFTLSNPAILPEYGKSFYIPIPEILDITNSARKYNCVLRIQDNGEVVIYNPNNAFTTSKIQFVIEAQKIFKML